MVVVCVSTHPQDTEYLIGKECLPIRNITLLLRQQEAAMGMLLSLPNYMYAEWNPESHRLIASQIAL